MTKSILTFCSIFFIYSLVSSQEKLSLTTDRDIYIGGESIWFTITNLSDKTSQDSELSKVAYVELLNSSKTPVLQQKLYLKDGLVTSLVDIPDSVSTGNYLLRCYTRWMTNFSPDYYEGKVISIVNPFANNSLPNNQTGTSGPSNQVVNKQNASIFNGLKNSYQHRQLVQFGFESEKWNYVTVSVVKKCLYNPVSYSVKITDYKNVVSEGDLKVPEYKGEIIKGKVIDSKTHQVVAGEDMMLSFVSKSPVLEFSETDEYGEFIFEANRFGRQEMVIQPYSPDTAKLNYKIELENNFSGKYSNGQLPELSLDTLLVNQLNNAIVNMQVNTIYASHLPDVALADSIEKAHSFYGQPENSILIDKYIDLPTTEEVVREIVPYVSVRKNKEQYEFRVYEEKSLYPNDGGTLPFVDGVPVRDVNRILNINPKYLENVDVVNLNYYMINKNLGRLVLFFTRDCDMGNMEFDNRIFRQVHDGYLNARSYNSPDYSNKELFESRLADYRNVLHYSSINNSESNEPVEVEFYTGDDSSEYTIVVTGINHKGEKETITGSFVVE